MAPNYVFDGPPGPAPAASVAICEGSLRRLFTPSSPSAGQVGAPQIVILSCDLDETNRAILAEKVNDLPLDLRFASSQNDVYSAPRTLSIKIGIKWIDNHHAYVSIWRQEFPSGQGSGTHADAKYESGQWRLYDSHLMSTIN